MINDIKKQKSNRGSIFATHDQLTALRSKRSTRITVQLENLNP